MCFSEWEEDLIMEGFLGKGLGGGGFEGDTLGRF